MSPALIIAQALGFAGLGSNIASVQCKRRYWVLIWQIAANLLYGVQYIFLGAWSGLAVCIISALECIIVYYYANRKSTKMPAWVLILIIVTITIAGCFSYTDTFSLIPLVVTALYSWAVWQPNLRIFRIISAIIPVGWFVYNLHVAAYVPMFTSIIECASAIAAIVRIDILGRKE